MRFLIDVGVGKKVEKLGKILTRFSDEIEYKFCVYQDGRLRIRK